MAGWIGVDLDGTLAFYEAGKFNPDGIGEPVPEMLWRVKNWLAQGKEVRIFTARASSPELIPAIKEWVKKHVGEDLPVTNVKDWDMVELWDDRAVQVRVNTGQPVGFSTRGL